ncbi:hypothetical protein [Mucilaginibacter sp.]|uniref:hypothetical protein n=1 Tax=Mucilaginibacter sp. TaxID=1882438 RepID=UPI00284CDD7D|nr:hypothetical protein [Mucilaginibacter sp.]MDR3695594.1 hypothetical protein [Mucilaginibacter sp.]
METDIFPSNSPAKDLYEIVYWPQVLKYMIYDWFTLECFLCVSLEEDVVLSTTYFVPIRRIMEIDES